MPLAQTINLKNQFTAAGYTYDAAGNVLADGSGITTCGGGAYTWNAEEQMSCAAGATYLYDGDGIRVGKSGGAASPTLYWGAGTLVESDTSGNVTSEYIFLGGRRIARRDVATGSVYFYLADALGSSSVVATAAGAIENESDFYPFGGELPVTDGLTNQHYKFEDKERDAGTSSTAQPQGLDYFGARFDSSATGRFMSPDWANKPAPVPYAKLDDPQSLNLYAFALNNPESAPDMDGHNAAIQCDLACGMGMADYQQTIQADAQAANTTTGSPKIHTETTITVTAKAHWWNKVGSWFAAKGTAISIGFIRWGRLGGPLHRGAVARISETLKGEGFTVTPEKYVPTPNGAKTGRFIDVYAKRGDEIREFQIGRTNANGTPVAREAQALDDIQAAPSNGGIRPAFISYNNPAATGEVPVPMYSDTPTEIPTMPGETVPEIPIIEP